MVFAGVPIITSGASPGALSQTHPAVTGALSGADHETMIRALSEVDGAFVGIWWSASRQELTVFTDSLGMQRLYRATTSDHMLLQTIATGRTTCTISTSTRLQYHPSHCSSLPWSPSCAASDMACGRMRCSVPH